jgi:esterase/lipase superfamily enzyme
MHTMGGAMRAFGWLVVIVIVICAILLVIGFETKFGHVEEQQAAEAPKSAKGARKPLDHKMRVTEPSNAQDSEEEARRKAEARLVERRIALEREVEQEAEARRAAEAARQAERRPEDLLRREEQARKAEEEARRQQEELIAAKRKAAEKELRAVEEEAWRRQQEALVAAELKAVEEGRRRQLEELRRRAAEEQQVSLRPKSLGPCDNANCTPVRVYFGTDRSKQESADRINFGPDRAGILQLGRAVVTVPRAVPRKRGEISRPTWYDLNVRGTPSEGDPNRHFTIPKGGVIIFTSMDDFLSAVQDELKERSAFKDHAFVFVHGFWTTFDDALYRTAQIAYDLGDGTDTFGTAFLYSWPSGGALRDYKYDFDSTRFAVEHLEAFLKLVASRSGATHLHVIAHSMGNWPMLAVLDKVARDTANTTKIDQVILAAPDIDTVEFAKMAFAISTIAKGVTLYASSNDFAMKAAREAHHGVPRAGDVPTSGPVIVRGVYTIDVSNISTDILGGHADYVERKELLNDIALILRNGQHPPSLRMPILETLRLKDLVYWRYPN